jgi:hypothetical protein
VPFCRIVDFIQYGHIPLEILTERINSIEGGVEKGKGGIDCCS